MGNIHGHKSQPEIEDGRIYLNSTRDDLSKLVNEGLVKNLRIEGCNGTHVEYTLNVLPCAVDVIVTAVNAMYIEIGKIEDVALRGWIKEILK